MTDVFISYARADRNRVRPIALALAAEGFSVWWDPEIKPGAQWNDAIRRALENAACVLTCWSKKSVKSQWVLAETTHGHGRQALVPVLIQTCEPPIPYNMMQAADLSSWRGNGADHEWQGVLEQVRRLVEAKRRLVAAAPPPGEAYGATRAGTPIPTAPDEPFPYTPSPRRFGPRLGQMLLGGAVITAVLTVGVFLAPRLVDQFAPSPPRGEAPNPVGVTGQGETPTATPEPEASPPADVIEEGDASPPPVSNPVPGDSAETPPPTPPSVAATPTADLDACANQLLTLCPGYGGGAVAGFRADGRLSGAEARFLSTLQIAVDPPSPEAVAACRGVVERRSSGATQSARRTLFDQACSSFVEAPTPAGGGQAAPAPSQNGVGEAIIDALPQILGQGRDTARPTTGRSGNATIPMGSLLDLGSGAVGSSGDIGLTMPYRRVTAASNPLLAVNDGLQIAPMGDGTATQAECARASYGTAPVPVEAGDTFCIRRRDGRYAVVTATTQPSANSITVRYQVWE